MADNDNGIFEWYYLSFINLSHIQPPKTNFDNKFNFLDKCCGRLFKNLPAI